MNNNKGYTLINMLFTLMILASMLTMTLKNVNKIETKHFDFINEYLNTQSISLTERVDNEINDYNVSFNALGHVNSGKTLNFGIHKVLIHLGNGYLTYE